MTEQLFVEITGTIPGGSGAIALFTPSQWLNDAPDELLIPPGPVRVILTSNDDGSGSLPAGISLLAEDSPGPVPSGWTWSAAFSGIDGVAAYGFSFLLQYANGASQDITALAHTEPASPMLPYLTLPSGTPTAGYVVTATGEGTATEFAPPSGGGSGSVTSVAVEDANGLTGTVADGTTTPQITLETTVTGLLKGNGTAVSAAEAGTDYLAPDGSGADLTGITVGQVSGAAPLASPAFTGTPTAPTADALTDNTQVATTAYTDTAVAVETSRAETAEAGLMPLPSGTPAAGQVPVATGDGEASAWSAPAGWMPADYGYAAYSFDPAFMTAATARLITAGVLWLIGLQIRIPKTVGNVDLYVSSAGATLTSGENLIGLYNSSGTLLGYSGDQSGVWNSTGPKEAAALTAQAGESLILPAGLYWVGLLGNGTTMPGFTYGPGQGNIADFYTNARLPVASSRYATFGSLQTALPTSFSPSSLVQAQLAAWWAGLY